MPASPTPASPRSVRFGPYEADLKTGELRKNGIKLKVSGQPVEILALLLDRPGEVVTREEIRAKLWPEDTFVDFDHSLNAAINKLREPLGDSADNPTYIETLPRRGYRFIGSIEPAENLAQAGVVPIGPSSLASNHILRAAITVVAALLLLAIVEYSYRRPTHSAAPAGKIMLAVLPFENLSGDVAQEYFSDGMTDEMIARLGDLHPQRLGVIARTSAMHYKNSTAAAGQIGRDLGVQYLLEGTVRRAGDRVRITAELVQVKDQTQLWAESYDRDIPDILSIQDEVAGAVARQIDLQLSPGQQDRLRRSRTINPAAYEAYLKGRYYLNSRKQMITAIESFQQAIALDPNYALAYAGLGETYGSAGYWGLMPPREANRLAEQAVRKAAQLDDTLAEVHTAFAGYACLDEDINLAEREIRRALEFNPSYANAHREYSTFLLFVKHDWPKANHEIEVARQLDPMSPFMNNAKAYTYYLEHDYGAAITQFGKTLELDPNFPLAYYDLGLIYTQQKMFKKAEAAMLQATYLTHASDAMVLSGLGYTYASAGRREKAVAQLQALRVLQRQHYVSPLNFARVYIGFGDKPHALALMEDAAADGSHMLCDAALDPLYDTLRKEPRFIAAVQKLCPWTK